MKAALIVIVIVSALALLAFAVHDLISFGMGMFSSASDAPNQFWDAVGDAFSWGIEYKEGATAVFLIGLAILYILKEPTIKSR